MVFLNRWFANSDNAVKSNSLKLICNYEQLLSGFEQF